MCISIKIGDPLQLHDNFKHEIIMHYQLHEILLNIYIQFLVKLTTQDFHTTLHFFHTDIFEIKVKI